MASLLPAAGPTDVLTPVWCDVGAWAGAPLAIELCDGGDGWLAIDQVLLVRREQTELGAASVAWTPPATRDHPALANLVQFAPFAATGGKARSGTASVTVTNPVAVPVRPVVALIAGPARAALRVGDWMVGDRAVDAIPPGGTARARLDLEVGEAVRLDLEPFVVRLEVQGAAPPGSRQATFDFELPWAER